ncbi:hypothetical protein ABIE69_001736 [Rhodobacteraceae bacterium MBR-64]|jgi:hypothetical protein
MLNAVAVTLLFVLSLLLWRGIYFEFYWAAAVLIPLWIFVFAGIFRNILDRRRSILLSTLREHTLLMRILSGWVVPALSSVLVSTLSVSTIAFYALFASAAQMLFLTILAAASALIYWGLLRTFRRQVNPLALSWLSASATIIVVTALFSVPYAYLEYSVLERPGYILMDFDAAMSAALAQVPRRNDFVNEVISALVLLDSAKLWLATSFTETLVPGVLFAAHSALICLVIATNSVGLASFYHRHIEKKPWQRTEDAGGPKHDK